MPYPSLTERFLEGVERHPTPRAVLHKVGDAWEAISSAELLRRVAGLAHALVELGVQPGDRVGLFSPNRPEWHVSDFAILGLGAANVPIYFNESPDRIVYILNDSGAKVVIAVGAEQADRLLECRAQLRSVEHVILAAAPADTPGDCLRFEALIAGTTDAHIAEYRRRAAQVRSDQLASIIYTSGTTGEPKGVMLTHSNFSSNDIDACAPLHFYPTDIGLAFLPLAHVYERIIDYGYLFRGIPMAYVERPELVQSALLEVRPTLMATVPRVFEKVYATVMEKGQRLTGRKRRLFDWAMRVVRDATPWRAHGQPVSLSVKLQWLVANWLAFPKIRAGLGGRLRSCSSGAAPLSQALAEFFWTVGVPIYQGYGLTETSPIVSTNREGANRVGSVGPPIANVEVRVAEDGELLVRGPCVMQGYYKKPEATREALGDDGWLRTGDVARLDADGYLYILDRKKDLIKTAAGKFVAPQPIENKLKTSAFILNAAIVGDRRRYVVALVVPNFASVEAEARQIGLIFAARAELAAHPWVHQLIGKEIAQLTEHLAQWETIKRFALLDHDFTFEGGQLTYTMKLKRRIIEERYADIIEQLYVEDAEASPQPQCEMQ